MEEVQEMTEQLNLYSIFYCTKFKYNFKQKLQNTNTYLIMAIFKVQRSSDYFA